jgi:flagellar biogenesis protein FliO
MHWIGELFRGRVWLRPVKGRALEQVDRLALTPQHSLHLVRLGGRALLIGRSPAGIALLDSSEWRAEPGEGAR